MKKFLFQLKAVLRYKTSLLDTALEELASLQQTLAEIERNIRLNREEFARLSEELRTLSAEGATPGEIGGYRSYLELLRKKELQLEEQKKTMLQKIEAKRQEVLELKKDVAGLEKLQERQYKNYLIDVQKAEEKELEEFLVSGLSKSVR